MAAVPPKKVSFRERMEAVKEAASLVDVMRDRGVEVTQVGGTLKARCPFHGNGQERTPSMVVSGKEGQERYYCFACQASGDVISFVQEY